MNAITENSSDHSLAYWAIVFCGSAATTCVLWLIVSATVGVPGCQASYGPADNTVFHPDLPPTTAPTVEMDSATGGLNKTAATVRTARTDGQAAQAGIERGVTEAQRRALNEFFIRLSSVWNKLVGAEDTINLTQRDFDAVKIRVGQLVAERDSLVKTLKDANDAYQSQEVRHQKELETINAKLTEATGNAAQERHKTANDLYTAGAWITVGTAVLAIVIFAFLKTPVGFLLLPIGPALAIYAYGIDVAMTYLPYLLTGGIVCVLACLGMLAYVFCRRQYKHRDDIKTHGDAVWELVDLLRRIKKYLTPDQTNQIFGDAGVAATWLSAETEALIEPIRKEIGDVKTKEAA